MTDAHKLHNQIVSNCASKTASDLELAYLIYTMRRYDLWRDSVGGIDTWEEYLKQPEINISTSKANQLITIYEYFGIDNTGWDLSGIPTSRLYYIAKNNDKPEKLQLLLSASKSLTTKDFKELFYDAMNGKDGEDGESAPRTYSYVIMKKCNETGSLTKVHDIDSKLIKEKFNLD